jgi:hypothetical protein
LKGIAAVSVGDPDSPVTGKGDAGAIRRPGWHDRFRIVEDAPPVRPIRIHDAHGLRDDLGR